jgi:hypothetical protein
MIATTIKAVEDFKEYYNKNKRVKNFDYRTLNILNKYTLKYAIRYIVEYKNKFRKAGGGFFKKGVITPLITNILELQNKILYFENMVKENLSLINKNKRVLIEIVHILKNSTGVQTQNVRIHKENFQIVKNNILRTKQFIDMMRNNILVVIKYYIASLIILNDKIKIKIKNGVNYNEMYYEDLSNLSNVLNNNTNNGRNILNALELKYAGNLRKTQIPRASQIPRATRATRVTRVTQIPQMQKTNVQKNTTRIDIPSVPTYKLPTFQNTKM